VEIQRSCFWLDFQARWKEWKTRFGFLSFPRFPRGGISTALFTSWFSERSDAEGVSVAALAHASLSTPFFSLGQNPNFAHRNLAPESPQNDDRTHPGPEPLPFSQAFLPPRSLRIDSPCISMRWALCTSRSRMLSAKVGSPICSCHLATGTWLVRIMERI